MNRPERLLTKCRCFSCPTINTQQQTHITMHDLVDIAGKKGHNFANLRRTKNVP